ncbi:MAG TPA: ribose-phosphate diphosphokinase [Thermoanaerobaculia bacterium]
MPAAADPLVFSLDSGGDLRDRVCRRLGVPPGRHEERVFEDGEHKIRPLESVRGRDVYLVASLHGGGGLSVDDKLVRVLTFLGTLRDAGAARLTAVAPYLCYARKDQRTKPRDPVTLRYVAALFEAVGIDRIVAVDVHNPAAYQNAFRVPAELLTALPAFVELFARRVGDRPAVVVSPDAGGVKRAERFRQALERRIERPVGFAFLEKFRSGGVVRGGTVVGEVGEQLAIVIDDLIASGTTLVRAAAACRERGAPAVWAAVTHGLFAAGAEEALAGAELERLVVLDTVPPARLDPDLLRRRVEVVDASPLLAAAIERLHGDGSLVELEEAWPVSSPPAD